MVWEAPGRSARRPRPLSSKTRAAVLTECWPCKSNSASPRLIASCAEPRWRLLGFRPGSGRRASPATLLLETASRAFSPDPVRLGFLAEPEPLADLGHEAAHGAYPTPFGLSQRAE